MCFALSLLPGLVGTAFVVVPVMAILTVAVVVSVGRAVVILISNLWPGRQRAQSGPQPAKANLDTNPVAACISPLGRTPFVLDPPVLFVRHQSWADCAILNTLGIPFAG
jgi:hypothetical protein